MSQPLRAILILALGSLIAGCQSTGPLRNSWSEPNQEHGLAAARPGKPPARSTGSTAGATSALAPRADGDKGTATDRPGLSPSLSLQAAALQSAAVQTVAWQDLEPGPESIDRAVANDAAGQPAVEQTGNSNAGSRDIAPKRQGPTAAGTPDPSIQPGFEPELPGTAAQTDNLSMVGSGSGVLTLADCEAHALANHPSLAELQARVDALQGKWLQAGLRPNPRIGFSGQQLFSGGEAEQMGLFVGQELVRSEKFTWDQQLVCRELEVARQRLAVQQQRILTDVRLAWFEVLIARRRESLFGELKEIADENQKAVEALLKAEEGTRVDLLRATLETKNVNLQQANAGNDSLAAWNRLAVLMGVPDLPPGPLDGVTDPAPGELDYQSLRERLEREHPGLQQALADQERAAAQLQRARVEPLPDVDFQSVVQHDNATGGPNAVLQVTFPIPVRNRNQGAIQQARSEWTAAAFAAESTGLSLLTQLANTWQRYRNASDQVREYSGSNGLLDNAQETLELIARAHRAGEIGYLDLLTAQRSLAQTQLLYIDALAEYGRSRIELEGLLLKDSQDPPPGF